MSINWFTLFYTLIGGVALFIFGMKYLSEGLQSMASGVIKRAIDVLARNRVLAVLMGVVVTMLVQSSSISTVMMSGFVNAGLMSLSQAIGFIFGANIGTTITGWIISIKVGKYGLLLLGIGFFPMFFAKSDRARNIGKLLFALGFIFFGLELMSSAFKPLRTNEEFISALAIFDASVWYSRLAVFAIGCALTMIIQSSSAMLGITIALASQGVITFETAAALVLGENIGTTITLWVASVGNGTLARRTALAHTSFNVFGVLIAFLIFPVYIKFIDAIVAGDPSMAAPDGSMPYMAVHIAAVHTAFNVGMTLLFLPFIQYLERFVCKVFPDKKEEAPGLFYFKNRVATSPELALLESKMILDQLGGVVSEMMDKSGEFTAPIKDGSSLLSEISEIEDKTDTMQYEITVFLSQTLQESLSQNQSARAQGIIRIADELESIGDYCERIVHYRNRLERQGLVIPNHVSKSMEEYWSRVREFYQMLVGWLDDEKPEQFEKRARKLYVDLSIAADDLKEDHYRYLEEQNSDPKLMIIYSDITMAIKRIKNHTMNIYEAMIGGKDRN